MIESVVNQAALTLKRKHVEDELRASEEKFAAAFRSSPNGILLSTLEEGTIIDINDTLLNFIGIPKEEIIGKKTLEIQFVFKP
ncbi:MAG: PAS domain S-box protein [Bacteroidales bacterium]|nr:PAS domain S-box protein [Bacteroidales bacterium]